MLNIRRRARAPPGGCAPPRAAPPRPTERARAQAGEQRLRRPAVQRELHPPQRQVRAAAAAGRAGGGVGGAARSIPPPLCALVLSPRRALP